jgi:hypothetical protein
MISQFWRKKNTLNLLIFVNFIASCVQNYASKYSLIILENLNQLQLKITLVGKRFWFLIAPEDWK